MQWLSIAKKLFQGLINIKPNKLNTYIINYLSYNALIIIVLCFLLYLSVRMAINVK